MPTLQPQIPQIPVPQIPTPPAQPNTLLNAPQGGQGLPDIGTLLQLILARQGQGQGAPTGLPGAPQPQGLAPQAPQQSPVPLGLQTPPITPNTAPSIGDLLFQQSGGR